MNSTVLSVNIDVLIGIAAYVVGTCALRWIAGKVRNTVLGSGLALIVCCVGAYSFAIALHAGVMQVIGLLQFQPWWLFQWTVLGVTGFAIAEAAKPSGWLAMIPCCLVGAVLMMRGPLTGDPLFDIRLGSKAAMQYSAVEINASFAVGMVMIFLSVIAGMVVGAARDPAGGVPAPSAI